MIADFLAQVELETRVCLAESVGDPRVSEYVEQLGEVWRGNRLLLTAPTIQRDGGDCRDVEEFLRQRVRGHRAEQLGHLEALRGLFQDALAASGDGEGVRTRVYRAADVRALMAEG